MREGTGGFTIRTAQLLGKRAAYVCSRPDCRILTVGPADAAERSKSIGVAAHIRARSPGGARYDPQQTPQSRASPANGIWLCQNHAKEIDSDPTAFPREVLEQWKKEHDSYVAERFGKVAERQRIYEKIISSAQEAPQILEHLKELLVMMKQQSVVSHRISAPMPWTNSPDVVGHGQPLVSRARISASGVLLGGENVITVTDLGIGRRGIMWDQDYANPDYDVFLTVGRTGYQAEIERQSVGSVVILIHDYVDWPHDVELRVYAVGDGYVG